MIAVPNLYLLWSLGNLYESKPILNHNWKPGVIAHSVAPRSYIATSIAKIESACVTAFSPVNPSQMCNKPCSTAETAASPTNKNVSQDDSSDIPPLPEQNSRVTSCADPVTLPTSSPVTCTQSRRVQSQLPLIFSLKIRFSEFSDFSNLVYCKDIN